MDMSTKQRKHSAPFSWYLILLDLSPVLILNRIDLDLVNAKEVFQVPSQIIISSWIPPSPFPPFSHTQQKMYICTFLHFCVEASISLWPQHPEPPWCVRMALATRFSVMLPSARTHTASSCLHTRDHRWTHTSKSPPNEPTPIFWTTDPQSARLVSCWVFFFATKMVLPKLRTRQPSLHSISSFPPQFC